MIRGGARAGLAGGAGRLQLRRHGAPRRCAAAVIRPDAAGGPARPALDGIADGRRRARGRDAVSTRMPAHPSRSIDWVADGAGRGGLIPTIDSDAGAPLRASRTALGLCVSTRMPAHPSAGIRVDPLRGSRTGPGACVEGLMRTRVPMRVAVQPATE